MADFIKTTEFEMEIKVWSGRMGLKTVIPLDTLKHLILDNNYICERLGWTGRLRDEMKGWLIDDGQLEAGSNPQCPCTSMVFSLQKVFDVQSPDAPFDFRNLIIGLIESYATRPLFKDFGIKVNDIIVMPPLYMTFEDYENGIQKTPDMNSLDFEEAIVQKAERDGIYALNFYHVLNFIFEIDSLSEKFGWTKELRDVTRDLVIWRSKEEKVVNPLDSAKPKLDAKLKEALKRQPEDQPFNFAAFMLYLYATYSDIKAFFNNINVPLRELTKTSHIYALPDEFREKELEIVDEGPRRAVELPDFGRKQYPTLTTFGVLLTDAKKINDEFPITGREKEIAESVECLLRMQKNSLCIIGEPGVGKSSVAYELARQIVKGTVPPMLQGRHIVEIRLLDIISGAQTSEDAAKLFKNALDEASYGSIILFIDEIHTLVTEKTLDAANILKPYLTDAKGISVIGATTNDEYSKYIRRDGALNRRFTPIRVNEPDREAIIQILNRSRVGYERHYSMNIGEDAIEAVADYSRLIMDKNNPDKALELLEGTCAHIVAQTSMNDTVYSDEDDSYTVGKADIARKVCQTLRLPLGFLISEGDADYEYENMFSNISKNIFGQSDAVEAVANQLANAFTLHDEGKPLASFLFAGPTGVGKSELAGTVADIILGGRERHLITLDMAEFTEKSSVSKLIGSPPGHGDTDALDFVDELQKKPPSVIAVDGIENAHTDVIKIFSKILDEGKLQNTKERSVNFEKTIIIFTSNYGFDLQNKAHSNNQNESFKELKQKVGLDFINRVDDVLIFNELDIESLVKIAKLNIEKLSEKFVKKGYKIEVDEDVYQRIAEVAAENNGDARMIKSFIKKEITSGIRDEMKSRVMSKEQAIHISLRGNGELSFS